MMTNEVPKVRLNIVGLDGNAFALIGNFQRAARQQGFAADWIDGVVKKMMAGDYDHLLSVLVAHTEDE